MKERAGGGQDVSHGTYQQRQAFYLENGPAFVNYMNSKNNNWSKGLKQFSLTICGAYVSQTEKNT